MFVSLHQLVNKNLNTGIPQFTLLIWGHQKTPPQKQKPRKSRLFSTAKGKENGIKL